MFPFPGVHSPKEAAEQNARAGKALHRSKMALINAIRENIENPGTNKTIGDLLRAATPVQRARVRAHLQERSSYWHGMGAPIEGGIADRALRAFDAKKYDNGHIARYLTRDVIERIFG